MLYQQGQKIEIVVKGMGVSGSDDTKMETETSNSAGGGKTWRTAVFGSENQQRINRVIKTNATHMLAVGKQVALLGINYKLQGRGYEYGDQSYQELTQRNMELITDTSNVASAVGMGALYGSWGGPIGAMLGATLGAVSSIASLSVKYKTRERDYSVKMFKQENQIAYQRARASINLTTGRLR